jgi:uncharacterized membrane protein YkvA (DUF1232 family)
MSLKDRIRSWARSIKREGIALWFAVRDPRTPMLPKVLCAIVVAYALSPIDLIPDFIPILGFVDDALLLPGLMWLAIKAMPPDLLTQCRQKADDWMQNGGTRPKSLVGAVAIVLLWLASFGLIWLWWTST